MKLNFGLCRIGEVLCWIGQAALFALIFLFIASVLGLVSWPWQTLAVLIILSGVCFISGFSCFRRGKPDKEDDLW